MGTPEDPNLADDEPGDREGEEAARELAEKICEEGEEVFCHSWNGGGMNNGITWAHRLGDKYATSSTEFGTLGPYDTLEEALDWASMRVVNSTTDSIDSPLFTAEEIAAMLTYGEEDDYEPCEFLINNEEWIYDKTLGRFRRV